MEKRRRIWRVLVKMDVLIWAVFLFFLLLLAVNSLTSAFGFSFVHFVHGDSMLPTMDENTWVVSKKVPFSELQVGDIITFRERKDSVFGKTAEISSNLSMTPKEERTEEKVNEVIKAAEEPPKEIEYTDDTIMHRIVAISEEGIITQGDNNNAPDHFPVVESGYLAKTVFFLRYVAWPMVMMRKYYLWVIGAAVLLGIVAFIVRGEPRNQDQRDSL